MPLTFSICDRKRIKCEYSCSESTRDVIECQPRQQRHPSMVMVFDWRTYRSDVIFISFVLMTMINLGMIFFFNVQFALDLRTIWNRMERKNHIQLKYFLWFVTFVVLYILEFQFDKEYKKCSTIELDQFKPIERFNFCNFRFELSPLELYSNEESYSKSIYFIYC